ncbi:MAG: GDP-mannose 4,6-dehydratase [Chloroherpetonaceae bacterium]|nr:GDP-mannose 4,6-dehydratase [Chloroherpetonaceae bacterium]
MPTPTLNILVTGGAGFIGSNFIRYMLAKRPTYNLINYDKLTYAGNLENLRNVENKPRYKFVKGDICDADKLRETFRAAPNQCGYQLCGRIARGSQHYGCSRLC